MAAENTKSLENLTPATESSQDSSVLQQGDSQQELSLSKKGKEEKQVRYVWPIVIDGQQIFIHRPLVSQLVDTNFY